MSSSPNPIMGTYNRFPITLSHGEGSVVFDDQGKRYIDLLAGISVLNLGHCPKNVGEVLKKQIDQLWHVSNLYGIEPQQKLAEKLVELTCFDQTFFCNSGTEAVEASLKLARIASKNIHGQSKKTFIAMKQSFHGRTFGSLSVTGQPSYQEPFEPLVNEVRFVSFGDIEAIKNNISEDVAAVIVEPLQAEGGLHVPPPGYLSELRQICNDNGVLLIFDEVQVGMGRLGNLFAYQKYEVEPDIMTLAKGLGGGFPIGAILAKHNVSQYFVPGTHASTFGGNPLATSTALEVLNTIAEGAFLEDVRSKATLLQEQFQSICQNFDSALEVKGDGLLMGIKFNTSVAKLVGQCLEKGLLIGSAGPETIRFAPALNIANELLLEGIEIFKTCIQETVT